MENDRKQPPPDESSPSREEQDQPASQDGSKDAPYHALTQPTRPRTNDGPDARENEQPHDSVK